MITPDQIKAARVLLNWRQSDLARAAKVSLNAVGRVEREAADTRTSTLRAIQAALEEAGIEFIDNGVRRVR